MNERDYLTRYIDSKGGISATAKILGMPYSSLAAIANGYRGISPKQAKKMFAADPMLDANRLIWVRATKTEAGKAA